MIAAALPSDLPAVAVLGIGASSPIGYGVRPIQAAMAGSLSNFQEASLIGHDGEPVRTSRLPEVDEAAPRAERLAVLTRFAVADLLASIPVELTSDIPVFVGMGAEAPESDLRAIGQVLAEAADGRIDPEAPTFRGYGGGRIAFFSAMASAVRSFAEGKAELALIAAVDTRCTTAVIDSLIRERRLLTGHDDGTIPGEAAVMALVTPPRSTAAKRYTRFLVAGPAFAKDDPETIQRSSQATDGLGRAFRVLREHPATGARRPAAVVAFGTGELAFTRAFATGYLRNAELMPDPLRHELIATSLGDTGAAAGGMALLRAEGLMHRWESEEDHRILVYGHADDGRCAAALAIRGPS